MVYFMNISERLSFNTYMRVHLI